LDGKLVLEHQVPFEKLSYELHDLLSTAEMALEQGQEYDLRLEYRKPADERNSSVRLGLMRSPADQADRIARAAAAAGQCDAAVVFAGLPERYETEGRDRVDWTLPGPQIELIEAIYRANPRTVVVLNCGAPVALRPWIEEIPAVVEAFYPGMEGGHAIADLLLGQANPSGKLPFSFPCRFEDNPTYLNYPGRREVRYGEGIFVGYRYYDTARVEPLFPFGHGLSYTQFSYEKLKLPANAQVGKDVRVSCQVSNTGSRAGKEVVQLYVQDTQSSLPRPLQELKGFQKVALEPGESRTVEFSLDERAFSFYDPVRQTWVCEPGRFEIRIGASSRDIRLAGFVDLV
jgi:beta-glucosidase